MASTLYGRRREIWILTFFLQDGFTREQVLHGGLGMEIMKKKKERRDQKEKKSRSSSGPLTTINGTQR